MRNHFLLVFLSLSCFSSCDAWVQNVPASLDQIEDRQLQNESQIKSLVIGLENQFAITFGQMALYSDLMSDAFYTTSVANIAHTDFDNRITIFESAESQVVLENAYRSLATYRLVADDLLSRLQALGTLKDVNLQANARFKAYFHGAMARYFLATYWGLKENQGGGTINGGAFESSDALYDKALNQLDAALVVAPDEYNKRLTNTLKARIFLFKNDRIRALAAAQLGLKRGDSEFLARFDESISTAQNLWWKHTIGQGTNRIENALHTRFANTVKADLKESNRIPLVSITINGITFQRQDKYKTGSAPLVSLSWQENELMLAELEFNAGSTASALSRVNGVRNHFALNSIPTLNFLTVMEERDKTLLGTGLRLPDQRRTNTLHASQGAWNYLSLPASERKLNPNLR